MAARQQTVDKEPSPLAPVPQVGQRDADASGSRVPLPRRPRLADYVARYPLLGPVEQLPNDLIVNEYYARRRYGDRPTHAEYLDAFGSRHPDLAKQLQAIDDGMAAAEHLPPDLVSENGLPPGTTAQQFGEYVLLEKLGEGGMGVVHKARHRRMKRLVAVKMIAKREVGSPDAVKRFYREVETAAKLEHPNIVTAYDAGEHEGLQYLVMQYVEGKDLAAIVQERGPLPIAEAVDYVIQAARGLQYAHKHQIIHRDIKPSNLLLDKEGTVKILDMGLASIAGLADDPARDRLTGSGQLMGTCDYMAPEQALDAHHADARADIYSLGCTLYRLLTGRVLYKGESLIQVLLAHRESPIPSLCQARPDVPPQLDAAYQKMVAKRPEDRYQSMTEVLDALETCVDRPSEATPSRADVPLTSAAPRDLFSLQVTSSHGPTTAAGERAERLADVTLSQQAPAAETSKHLGRDAKLLAATRKKKTLALAVGLGLLGVAGIIALAVLISVRTSWGTLEIQTDDPNVHVAVKQNGELVEVVDAKSGWKISLNSGQYELAPQGSTDQFQLDQNSVFVKRGDTVKVKLTLQRTPGPPPSGLWKLPPGAPPPAVAPFDAKKAKGHQEAWAKYLGVPAEITNSIGMKLVLIPPGEFEMGSPKELIEEQLPAHAGDTWYTDHIKGEGPRHRVRITEPFCLGMYEVTQCEYERVMDTNPSEFSATGVGKDRIAGQDTKRFPVENVTWADADEFCSRLSEMRGEKAAGRTYLLPSEAQWEYACRAGSTGRYSFSSGRGGILSEYDEHELANYAWYDGNAYGTTHAVGGKRANGWGIYDMYGNVREWCQDWFDKDYFGKSPVDDPAGPPQGSERVGRGEDWTFPASTCRSAFRHSDNPGTRDHNLGFRACVVLADWASQRTKVSHATDAAKRSGTSSTSNAAVPTEPIVPAKPVALNLKPDAKAWDLKTGSPLNPASLVIKPAAIKGLRSWTLEVCGSRGGSGAGQLSPDDRLYATGGWNDGVIRFLDPATGKLRIVLVNPELEITALTWSPDSAYVAVGCTKGMVHVWNVAKGTIAISPTSSSTSGISRLAWSPDGTLLAIARSEGPAVDLWDVREARQSAVLQAQADMKRPVRYVAWSPDGKHLMVTTDLAVRIWDVAGARLVRTLDPQVAKIQPDGWVPDARHAAAWSPDGKRIATLCWSTVHFFDSTYKPVASGSLGEQLYSQICIAWSPDGRQLAGAWLSGCSVLYTHSGLQEFAIDGPGWCDSVPGLSWSKDNARLLRTHCGGSVAATDARSGKPLWQFAGRHGYDICISPDRRQYATAGDHDRLYTWDAIKGAPAQDYGPVFPARGQVSWSTDGRLAVAGNGAWGAPGDPGARIWDAGQPGMAHVFNDSGYRCAAWSPDGKILARGGADVLLWTSDPDDPHKVFHPDAEVAKLAWGANNSTLAAGLDNNKVVILEMPSGKVLKTLTREGLDGGIRYLAVVADGRLVAASGNGAVSVWNAKWETVGDLVRLKKTVRQGSDLVRVEINVNDGTMPAPVGRDDDRLCNIGRNRALGRRQAGHPEESGSRSDILGGLVGPGPPPDRRPRRPDRHLRRAHRRASGVTTHLVWPGEASVAVAGRPRALFPGNERGCGLCGPDRRGPASHPSPGRVRRQVWLEERPGEDTALFRRGEMTQVRSTGFSRKCAARPPEGGTTNSAFPTACSISSAAATNVPVQAPAAE